MHDQDMAERNECLCGDCWEERLKAVPLKGHIKTTNHGLLLSGAVPCSTPRRVSEPVVEKLLDAAFHLLQHDTGTLDKEYIFLRKTLKDDFLKILKA